ncbi:MAG: ribbon-helix-helix domain-containing protein [Chloroflexi bacterium]|nr:ribbon-helix-helix domain-containing protein [Chloroflexota bacterium]
MRVHITLDEADIRRLDARVGSRRRSRFIAEAVRRALDDEHRWEFIDSAIGAIPDDGHDWDADAATWVHAQRRADPDRVG